MGHPEELKKLVAGLSDEEKALADAGDRVGAQKAYRSRTGSFLPEAQRALLEYESDQGRGPKQVIVIRKDLKMRRGKEIAQGAHSSQAWLVALVKKQFRGSKPVDEGMFNEAQQAWLWGLHKKVCCTVDSEAALLAVAERARECGVECHVVTDSGLTEFRGVATKTCLAIGPDWSAQVDQVTGEAAPGGRLQLY